MSDKMTFPETWEEFEKSYGFDDSEEIYTNGSRLIPSFRVKQWLDHEESKRETKQQATVSSDCISRQDAKDAIDMALDHIDHVPPWVYDNLLNALNEVPSVQAEEAVPHRNYKYLSDFWCECGNHLGKKGDVKYCSDCGKKVKWDE